MLAMLRSIELNQVLPEACKEQLREAVVCIRRLRKEFRARKGVHLDEDEGL